MLDHMGRDVSEADAATSASPPLYLILLFLSASWALVALGWFAHQAFDAVVDAVLALGGF